MTHGTSKIARLRSPANSQARALILRSFLSPGDILMLTAAVRDLHAAYPHRFQTDVRTSADAIWENNPYLTSLDECDPLVRTVPMHYPAVHASNERPGHFVEGYTRYLQQVLELPIPTTQFKGDIHLTNAERAAPPQFDNVQLPQRFWILVAGGKYDFTAKWWNPDSFQQVVDHFHGRLTFVQCGEQGHWHPPIDGTLNLVGRTSLRQFIHLVHFADGVLCPVTLAMHLAAAVDTRPHQPNRRPCVVVAGGREAAHWEAYPSHQFISLAGALPCCAHGGCWRSRCQLVGDGDAKDHTNLCEQPVRINHELQIPRCMSMIRPQEVIRRIEWYYEGGVLSCDLHRPARPHRSMNTSDPPVRRTTRIVRVNFRHGLGDCAYFAHLIPLYLRRGYEIEVVCDPDKAILFQAAGARIVQGDAEAHPWGYPAGGCYEGQGRFWQGSKMGHNISQPPLPDIGDQAELWEEYCNVRIAGDELVTRSAQDAVEKWLERLQRPIVLLHTKGNTAQSRKSLPDDIAARFYAEFLFQCDGTLVLLDWDNRVPRMASYRIRHLDELGTCHTEALLALMARADLIIGVDSGPLHAARFTDTPTIGVWMPGHYPTTYALPRPEQANLVLQNGTSQWNRLKRIPWNLVEHPGAMFDANELARWCQTMLESPRYLQRNQFGADLQLQQFVRQWCRGRSGNALSECWDRNRSLDLVLQELSRRCATPTVVETGSIRAEEDWSGAGFFTYLAGAYLHRHGGRLYSLELSPANCEFARTWTSVFGHTVSVHCGDSVRWLEDFAEPIDLLYLDSLDTTEPGHADHALREAQVAAARLQPHSLIVIDDTPWHAGTWIGKGARAVPWLLQQGWRVLYAGYQVVLARDN